MSHNHAEQGRPPTEPSERRERGSTLVITLFALVLLAGMGIVLLSLGQNEVKTGQATLQVKQALFLAEAGLEKGRATLLGNDSTVDLDTRLDTAAGSNDTFDFEPSTIRALYNSDGEVTGFTGYGDDVPLRGPTHLGEGVYAAFLTNDPEELLNGDSADDLDNRNARAVVYGVGSGRGNALEVVQAVVEIEALLP